MTVAGIINQVLRIVPRAHSICPRILLNIVANNRNVVVIRIALVWEVRESACHFDVYRWFIVGHGSDTSTFHRYDIRGNRANRGVLHIKVIRLHYVLILLHLALDGALCGLLI